MNYKKGAGMTLIEILLVCVLFMMCLAMITKIFSSISNSLMQSRKKILIMNSLRSSLDILSSELRECYGPDNANIAIYDAGPDMGERVRFNKRSQRKNKGVTVEYSLDSDKGSIQRNDYALETGELLSSAYIGDYISKIKISRELAGDRMITISVEAVNPTDKSTIHLDTSATIRSGEELASFNSKGKKRKTGSPDIGRIRP